MTALVDIDRGILLYMAANKEKRFNIFSVRLFAKVFDISDSRASKRLKSLAKRGLVKQNYDYGPYGITPAGEEAL